MCCGAREGKKGGEGKTAEGGDMLIRRVISADGERERQRERERVTLQYEHHVLPCVQPPLCVCVSVSGQM